MVTFQSEVHSKQLINPELLNAHARDAQRVLWFRNVEKISGPKRSVKITYRFTYTSDSVI